MIDAAGASEKRETMKDARIIELFWQRDETALTEVETNMPITALQLHGKYL